jgi:hypothetical protein
VGLRLPEPMLARAGTIPHGRGWTFEPELDGFPLPRLRVTASALLVTSALKAEVRSLCYSSRGSRPCRER